jgi:hypothetical protein
MDLLIDNVYYKVTPSKRRNKKYDVFIYDKINKKINYLLSYGDKRYQHYFDKFGYYSDLDHLDEKRRDNYLKRSGTKNTDNINSSNYWARNFLW